MALVAAAPRGRSGSRVSGGPVRHAFRSSNLARPRCARILHRRAAGHPDDSGAAVVSAGRPEGPALRFAVPCAVAPVRFGPVRRRRHWRRLVAPRVSGQERWSAYPGRIGGWLKRRLDLVAPCGFLLAGSTVSYLVTVRHQWGSTGLRTDAYLSPYYYQGKFDAHSIFEVFEFSIDGIWSLLTYPLPEVVAIAALAAFAILLVAAFLGKFRGKPMTAPSQFYFRFALQFPSVPPCWEYIRLGAFAKLSIWVRLSSWRPAWRFIGPPVGCPRSRAGGGRDMSCSLRWPVRRCLPG